MSDIREIVETAPLNTLKAQGYQRMEAKKARTMKI